MSKHADLTYPNEAKAYIAESKKENGEPYANSTKNKMVFCYDCLCQTYGIAWEKPNYEYEPKTPIIPTTDNVNKTIAGATRRYITIFTIMAETAVEGAELTE